MVAPPGIHTPEFAEAGTVVDFWKKNGANYFSIKRIVKKITNYTITKKEIR